VQYLVRHDSDAKVGLSPTYTHYETSKSWDILMPHDKIEACWIWPWPGFETFTCTVFSYTNSRLSPGPAYDSFQPQASNNLTFQNLPIPDQVHMLKVPKAADRYVVREWFACVISISWRKLKINQFEELEYKTVTDSKRKKFHTTQINLSLQRAS